VSGYEPIYRRAATTSPARGAYGVAVAGLEAEQDLLVPAEADWPTVRIVVDGRAIDGAQTRLDDEVARYPDALGGEVEVDRHAGVAIFRGEAPPSPDEIVHPRLGMLGAVYAQWLPRRMAFHAGAFISGDRAWAVVGEQLDGKSTLLGALALAGMPVLGDDTLVLDEGRCLSGVRCVDLRPDAAAHLGVSDAVVRRGRRVRMPVVGPEDEPRLAGWLFLTWGETVASRALETPERIARIGGSRGWHRRGVSDPQALLECTALPAWELSRPRDWGQLPRVVEVLRELTE
jgi:hypothetical protein